MSRFSRNPRLPPVPLNIAEMAHDLRASFQKALTKHVNRHGYGGSISDAFPEECNRVFNAAYVDGERQPRKVVFQAIMSGTPACAVEEVGWPTLYIPRVPFELSRDWGTSIGHKNDGGYVPAATFVFLPDRTEYLIRIPERLKPKGEFYTFRDMWDRPDVLELYIEKVLEHELTHVQDRATLFRADKFPYDDQPGEVRAFAREIVQDMPPLRERGGNRSAAIQSAVAVALLKPFVHERWARMSAESKKLALKYIVSELERP